jgi:predicted HTH transcriptional regulator
MKNIESQNIEFKSNWKDEYLKVICAFAKKLIRYILK